MNKKRIVRQVVALATAVTIGITTCASSIVQAAETEPETASGETYQVTCEENEHGVITVDHENGFYEEQETVSITALAGEGYQLEELEVKTESENLVEIVEEEEAFSFSMPNENVTVKAVFGEQEAETETDQVEDTEVGGEVESETLTEVETGAESEQTQEESNETETETETDKVDLSKVTFRVNGDAYLQVAYGGTSFETGNYETITDSYVLELDQLVDGKAWMYAQATGEESFTGITLPQGVKSEMLRSLDGVGGFAYWELDFTDIKESKDIVVSFHTRERSARASGFNLSTTKKITGLNYEWCGGYPTMYKKKPVTGQSGIWGSGTWKISRPSLSDLYSLFGETKPSDAKYTNVGTDGNGKIYMRCTGVTDIKDHDGLSSSQAYIRCIEKEEDGESLYYTFMVWGANGGRGQTTEGYIQIKVSSSDTGIKFKKTIVAESITGATTDIVGNGANIEPSGARFRAYKLNGTGINEVADYFKGASQTREEWWGTVNSKAEYKAVFDYIETLIDINSEGVNPNPNYFKHIAKSDTDASGYTEEINVESGVKDWYIVLETRSPDGANLGWNGYATRPQGKKYFYKVFSIRNDEVFSKDATGVYESEGREVYIEDQPIQTSVKLKKVFEDSAYNSYGHKWEDFSFLVASKADFSNAVEVKLTGEDTTIDHLWTGQVYYIKENPNCKAITDSTGFTVNKTVYSFFATEDGKAIYSDTYTHDITAQEAVNSYAHEYIGSETAGVKNVAKKGKAQVFKVSSNTSISDHNSCYSLEGAEFKLVNVNTGKEIAERLVTKANGESQIIEVPAGMYDVIEVKAPKGFVLNETPVRIEVKVNAVTVIQVKNVPANDPIDIILQKIDAETGKEVPQGIGEFEGAEYTFQYYDAQYTSSSQLTGKTPLKTWVFIANENGKIKLNASEKVGGDDFYFDESGQRTFPLGTYAVKETKAPAGYLVDERVYIINVTAEMGTGQIIESTQIPVSIEQVQRADVKGIKIAEDMKRMGGVPFSFTSLTTDESHIMVTDKNGYFNSSSDHVLHSQNTNRGETAQDGIWFGEIEALDDTKGAFLFDAYLVEELPCEANKDKILLEPFIIYVNEDGVTVDLGTITNKYEPKIEIGTQAHDKETGENIGHISETTTIVDTVSYVNLVKGREYLVEGVLMDKATGKPLLENGQEITAKKTFVADKANGSVELEFTFNSSTLKGNSVVVFETMYHDGKEVAVHTDINDKGQTVTFEDPKIKTTASEKTTGEKEIIASKKVTIVDVIQYTGLIAGKEYTVKGILMDKAKKKPLIVNGKEVTGEKTFTAKKAEGSVEVEFTLNASELAGKEVVVFEHIHYEAREITAHADIKDKGQTVKFVAKKENSTTNRTTGGTTKSVKSVKTGDTTQMIVYLLGIVGAAVVILAMVVHKKRKEQ